MRINYNIKDERKGLSKFKVVKRLAESLGYELGIAGREMKGEYCLYNRSEVSFYKTKNLNVLIDHLARKIEKRDRYVMSHLKGDLA